MQKGKRLFVPSSTLPSTNSTNDTPPKKRSRLVVPEGFLSPVKETSSPSQQLLKERQAATPKPAQRTEVLDSEDEDSLSSDDSLVDLAELFKPKQNNLQSPPKLQTPIKKRRGKIIVSSPRIERISTTHKFKFDIKSLAKDDETKKKQDEQAARVKNLLSLPPPILTPVGEVDSGATTPTVKLDSTNQAELLSTVVTKKLKHTSSSDPIDGDDDPDAVQKVLRAMKRTGAGLQDLGWYFFTPHPSSTKPPPFDMSWTSYKWQVDIFFDEEELTNGLQDGLLLNLAKASGGLPKPIIEWGRIRMVYSQKSLERKAWEKVLLCAPSALKAALTPELISSTFIILGARHESVDLEEKMALVPVTPDHYFDRESKLPRGGEWEVLISFVQLLGHAAERDAIDHDTAEFALAVLCRLAVDTVVERHLTLFNAVRDTTGRLAAVWTDDAEWDEVAKRVSLDLFYALPSATLCLRLLNTLPSSSKQPRLHILRRRLAYAYLLSDDSILSKPISNTFSLPTLLSLVLSDSFQVDRHTDYALLTASLQLLNIALDDGSSVEAPNLSYMHLSRISLASLEKSAEEKAKEEKFNSDIDTLATALRDIWSSISEVGAGQVGKLDAREAIEMLRNRLLYTVRTKPALRKRIFDVPGKGSERKLSGYEGTGKQRNFMKGFLAKGKKT